jgi:hypothetical protein
MDWLISELKKRWVAFPEVMEYTGLSHVRACRLIDRLTRQYCLAERSYAHYVWFKILSKEDFYV